MSVKVAEVEILDIENGKSGLIILPENYLEKVNHRYHSSSLSFYKYAKEQLDIDFFDEPEALLEQRSGEWFGPVILITSMAYSSNPEIIAITCGVIANYVTDFFRGKKPTEIKVKVICKETSSTKYTEIEYNGNVEGLGEIKEVLTEVAKKDRNE